MKVLKRLALCLGAVLLAASCVGASACEKENSTVEIPKDDAGNVITELDRDYVGTLKLGVVAQNKERQIIESLAESFKLKYPNVEISYVNVTTPAVTGIEMLHKSGKAPDVFLANSFDMLSLDDKERLLDLSPYITQEVGAGTFDLDDYYNAYIKLGQRNFDGVQLMMPRSADRVVCHYNKKIIRDIEEETQQDILSHIKNGWTWDDFNTVCDMLNKSSVYSAPNRYLVDSSMEWEAVFNPIFRYYGVEYFSEDNKFSLNSENTKRALEMFRSWGEKGYVATDGTAANFSFGEGVMFFHSQSVSDMCDVLRVNAYSTLGSDTDFSEYYDVVTMPVFEDDPMIGAGAAGYCAYRGTKDPLLVWNFMKHIVSKEGQNAIADAGAHYVPVRKDMADYNDPENHWGIGFEKFNLSAYTYNSGGIGADGKPEPDWNCYTDYFIKPGYGAKADALNEQIGLFIKNYAKLKSGEVDTLYNSLISSLERSVGSILIK